MTRFNWVCGWNVPGFLPDTEPTDCETWEGARDALVWELERWESFDPDGMEADHAAADAVVAQLQAAPAGEAFTSSVVMGVVCWIVAAETPFAEDDA